MNIRDISTSRLKEYENNPRNNDLAVEKVKYSIERFGFLFPVVIDMNYTIVAGHTRVRACREMGISSVPCIIADELTEEQINLFRLVDNKTSEYSDWDFEKLKEELSLVDLTLDKNQLLLEQFELSAEVFDIDAEQAEIKIPPFNFMGANDDKAKSKKPPVSTIHSNAAKSDENDDVEENNDEVKSDSQDTGTDSNTTSSGTESEPNGTDDTQSGTENGPVGTNEDDSGTDSPQDAQKPEEKKKESKAMRQFCQFRFGDVSFFISPLELERLNEKYKEYIDSGEILKGSFVNYLLEGVENSD